MIHFRHRSRGSSSSNTLPAVRVPRSLTYEVSVLLSWSLWRPLIFFVWHDSSWLSCICLYGMIPGFTILNLFTEPFGPARNLIKLIAAVLLGPSRDDSINSSSQLSASLCCGTILPLSARASEVNDASPFSRFAWPAPEKEENRLLGEESSFVWAGSFAAIQNQALDTMDYSMDFSFSFEFEGSYSYDYDYYY